MRNTKKIYDSVHGFIRFNELEKKLIDSKPFQRLHFIHQLGIAFPVYPGATHTRFEHSLGAMELTSRIFDQIESKFDIPDAAYWKQILRLSALCHDLGHLPFSHAAENALLGEGGHEKWTLAIIESDELRPIWQDVKREFGKDPMDDVIKMSIGEKTLKKLDPTKHFSPWDKVLSQVISADFFGADRIDYLLRDAQCTGVSYGLFDYHQLIETLVILPDLQLGMEEDGIESCEALLLARHFMHKRVYQYTSVKAYNFHLSRFMAATCSFKTVHDYLALTESDILTDLKKSADNPKAKGHLDAACILDREKRFRAYKLPDEITEKDLRAEQKRLNIPDEMIAWDLSDKKKRLVRLSFPVVKRNGQIVDASQCSEIAIPIGSPNWVYVAPQYNLSL